MSLALPINFGQPSPEQVVGRDDILRELRTAVERGSSTILTGERRIGKSWVLKALADAPPPGWVAVYTDVEQISRLEDLHDVLAERITQRLPRPRRIFERLGTSKIKEIKGIPLPSMPELGPVDRLRRLIRGVASGGTKLIVILDELPILAQRLEATAPGDAVALLQLLRALRLEEPNVRMVLAGSIGFHHLLDGDAEIRAAINDVLPVPIGPLDPEAARSLTRRLLAGIGVDAPATAVVEAIASATDGVPFYIHHLVANLERRRNEGITAGLVAEVRQLALYGPDDPWQLRHYEQRLAEYFGPNTRQALAILDAIASVDDGLALAGVLDRVRTDARLAPTDPMSTDTARGLADRLRLDHYLTLRPDDLHLAFTLPIVRDAWRALRVR